MIPARVVLSVESRTTSFVGTYDFFLRMHTYVPVFQIDFPDWVMESERMAFVVDSTVGLSLRSKLRFVLMFFFQNLSELPDTPCCRFVLLPRNAHGEPNSRNNQKTKSHCSYSQRPTRIFVRVSSFESVFGVLAISSTRYNCSKRRSHW